jgi:hypothetical protein
MKYTVLARIQATSSARCRDSQAAADAACRFDSRKLALVKTPTGLTTRASLRVLARVR